MKWILILMLLMRINGAYAQTWEEWMEQKKTSLKYLTEHILALKAYAASLQKGYKIAQSGLTNIDAIKKESLHLHAQRFDALIKASPQVISSATMMALQVFLFKVKQEARKIEIWILRDEHLQTNEKKYLRDVLTHLIRHCDAIDQEVKMFTVDGAVQMTDDERISRINTAYNKVQHELQFLQSFKKEIQFLVIQRLHKKQQVKVSENLYGF